MITDTALAPLAKALDTSFSRDLLMDSDLIRQFITFSEQPTSNSTTDMSRKSIFDKLEDEDSLNNIYDDEVTRLMCATSSGGHSVDPLSWWTVNECRFHSVADLARNVLSVEAWSVPSESDFSISRNLIVPNRSSHSYLQSDR